MRALDITGNRFGRLVAFEKPNISRPSGGYLWKCLCDCGNETIVSLGALRNGSIKSCGCLRREVTGTLRVVDLIGRIFGRLVVVKRVPSTNNNARWRCACNCGNMVDVMASDLKTNKTQSCGCLKKERSTQCAIQRNKAFGGIGKSKSGTLFLDKVEHSFGISIEREFCLENKLYDGRLGAILIEVDGSYWHRDSVKNDYLKDQIALRHGFCIIRISLDAVKDVSKVFKMYKKSLIKAFKLKGVL